MLISNVPCVYLQTFPLCNELEHSLEMVFNVSVSQYFSTVFGTPYEVVITHPRCMIKLIESSVHLSKVTLVDNIDQSYFILLRSSIRHGGQATTPAKAGGFWDK